VLFPNIADKQLHAFIALLVTIVVTIMVVPLFETHNLRIGRLMMAAVIVLSLRAAGIRPRAWLFFLPILVGYLVALDVGGLQLSVLAITVRALFFGYATVVILRHTVRAPKVTADTIAGAACAYVLTAVTWATGFELLELVRPGSFDIPPTLLLQPSHDPSFALVYFSFTTLTTLGYGDIHPISIGAGGLAVGEAVVGQLYVAITIARLVSLQLTQQS